MLFQSMLPSLFEKLSVSAVSQLNAERKKETQKRLDYFHDDTVDYLGEHLEQLFSNPDSMVKCQLNIVKKIISQLAQVYRDAPAREIQGNDQDKKIFKQITETAKLDVVLKQASRYTKLLKTILLRPVWRSGKMQIDILTGEILDVVTGDTPEDLLEVLITDYGSAQRIEEITFSHWTADAWKRLNYSGQVIEEAENPYQVLPFVPIFDYLPPGTQFWLPGGQDLIEIQDAINIKLVDLLYLLANQSFGVGYLKGGEASGGSLRVDPGSLVELSEDGEIGFASQKARIAEVVQAIDFADPSPPVDPKMQAESWQLQLDMGVISPVDIIMQLNPDLKDREDALAQLIKLRQENEELNIPRPSGTQNTGGAE